MPITIDEAIELLNNEAQSFEREMKNPLSPLHNAIICKRRAEEFGQIADWLRELKALRELNEPMKPSIGYDCYDNDGNLIDGAWYCPNCEEEYDLVNEEYSYCPNCGQIIDWEALREDQKKTLKGTKIK